MKQTITCCAVFVLMAACLVSSNPIGETDIVTEILRAIDGRQGFQTIAMHLNESRAELVKELPLVSSDGQKLSYTFFLPTSWSFLSQIPADAPDPFFLDSNFRRTVFIRHFARQQVASGDLAKLDKLVMADSKEATLSRTSGVETINDAEIQKDPIQLANNAGIVYIVDRVFMTGVEVGEVLKKNPRPGLGLFEKPPGHPALLATARDDEPAGIHETPLGAFRF